VPYLQCLRVQMRYTDVKSVKKFTIVNDLHSVSTPCFNLCLFATSEWRIIFVYLCTI